MTRYLSRVAIALTLSAFLILNLAACQTSKLVNLAERSGAVAIKLKPVAEPLVASGVLPKDFLARLDQYHNITVQLADAFRSGGGNSLDLTAQAIQFVERFINSDAALIKDPATRTLVMAILAGADIALGEIADALNDGAKGQPTAAKAARSARPAAAATVAEFGKKPRLRCRDAKTGRFAKMEFCEANPGTTVVERPN